MLQKIPPSNQPLWIFAYGALMWNPGFHYTEEQTVRIYGYHRALCVWSWHYRGSQQQPGLVFGLDHGGSCAGKAFRVKANDQPAVLRYLQSREMITHAYKPSMVKMHFGAQTKALALTFIVDRSHPQYAGRLHHDTLLQTVCAAQGSRGQNREYVSNTLEHLEIIGYRHRQLLRLGRSLSLPSTHS